MIYEFNKKVINASGIKDFYKKNNFVGYILPDGDIFKCQNHNVEDIDAILKMYLHLLEKHYNDRDVFLDKASNKLTKVVIDYFKRLTYEQVIALKKIFR